MNSTQTFRLVQIRLKTRSSPCRDSNELRLETYIVLCVFLNQYRIPFLSPPSFAKIYTFPCGNCPSFFQISCDWTVTYSTSLYLGPQRWEHDPALVNHSRYFITLGKGRILKYRPKAGQSEFFFYFSGRKSFFLKE